MKKKILLVNPPILDFSAYDFWLKPYGLLRVGGYLRNKAELTLFDFLDRSHPVSRSKALRSDPWGRGKFLAISVEKPKEFAGFPRRFRRYGLPRSLFRDFLASKGPFDAVLVQTNMTYWYLGVKEVLRTVDDMMPGTKIVLGGIYATLCPEHASGLGADLVVEGCSLQGLWNLLDLEPDETETPYWEGYEKLTAGVLKLADGCPFRCTYCSVPRIAPDFQPFAPESTWNAFNFLRNRNTQNIVFYDDSLLFQSDRILVPFLERVIEEGFEGNFHTPNALNARFITPEIARLTLKAGFQSYYLGFESGASSWQRKTGGKVSSGELESAVAHLLDAGATPGNITAYLIVGHPDSDIQEVEGSMRLVHSLGIRIMLSEYSPIPGTPDGERCRPWIDLDNPLLHNKTFFALTHLGGTVLQELKDLCARLNAELIEW
jgi:radical SAM superfamily enzyme YgiQ (UPF0313 family)